MLALYKNSFRNCGVNKLLLLSFCLFSAFAMGQTVRINEVQSANETTWMDGAGDFDDWIELYNTTDEAIFLGGWYLSDDPIEPDKWSFDDGPESWIEAGGYLVIFIDDETDEGFLHANFALDQTGEQLFLSDHNLNPIDQRDLDFCWQDLSWGYNDAVEWTIQDQPSPGIQNSGLSYAGTSQSCAFSENGGVKDNSFELILTSEPGAIIYYTTDGSNPTDLSPIYDSPINISSNTTVKTIAKANGKVTSLIKAQTYLFDVDLHNPIITLSCEEDVFSGPQGLDNQPYSNQEDVMQVCFFDEDGNQIHDQTVGLKVHAPDARDQRSFRMYARGEYGESSIKLDLFPNRDFDEHKRLVLRNSGNDGIEINGAGLRDALITGLYQSIDPSYGASASKPVNVFINGNYWGLYNLRERQDEHWLGFVYGLECDDVDYLERTAEESDTRTEWCGDWQSFDEMQEMAINLDMSVQENYESVITRLDFRNFIDYQFTEIYAVNQDWLSNNMKFWKRHGEDEVWNHVIWDVDWGLGTYYPNYPHGFPDWNALNFALSNWGGWTTDVETEFMQNLVMNETFVDDFSTRTADLLNSKFKPDVVIDQLLAKKELMEPDIPEQTAKWGSSVGSWNAEIEYMIGFIEERPVYMRQHYTERFGLGEIDTITVGQYPSIAGHVEVNTIRTDEIPWEGIYFENVPIRLKAMPAPGFVFDHWEGPAVDGLTDQEIEVNLLESPEVTAVYFEADNLPNVQFTEIMYYATGMTNSGDWVEVANLGDDEVNLLDWEFCADADCYVITEEIVLQPGERMVLAQENTSFLSSYPEVNSGFVTGPFVFGLSTAGEQLILRNEQAILIDDIIYSPLSPWPDNTTPNHTIELMDEETDNSVGSHWVSQEGLPGGSPSDEYVFTPVGIAEANLNTSQVYPNPFSNTLVAEVPVGNHEARVQFFDVMGREVLSRWINKQRGSNRAMITDLDDLASGSYVLRVSNADWQVTLRVQKH